LTLQQRLAGLPAWAHWAGLCAAAALGALLARGADPALLRWQPELAISQPWRLVSAAWVHLSDHHLLANLAGTAVLAALGHAAGCDRRAATAWALAWPLTQAGLLAQPALLSYGGLSGVLHAGVAVAAWQLLRGGVGPRRWIGAAIAAGLLAKLLLEAPWQGPLRQVPGWDIAIAPAAHASGALAGWLCALACGVGRTAGSAAHAGP
jgi:rhomboid family GlyGly-CTERM serine protease